MEDNSQSPSLLDIFGSLDDSTKEALADIESPLGLGLAALYISENQAYRPYMTVEHIVAALEVAGVAVTKTQISKAFSRAGDRVSRSMLSGETSYRIMTKGRRQIEPFIQSGEIHVSYIQGGKPRTARKILSELLNNLSGDIRICDPYYGVRSLDALEMLPDSCNVKFLTAQSTENAVKLTGAIVDFRREHIKTEIRIFPDPKAIHDRYVLTDNNLLILGHGIKDIGNKESFVISVSNEQAGDLISSLIKVFDERWDLSKPI
jgi:hypothetical protein